ncbi:UDP-N-acetylmuramoyl-tripeptide--D-alanyl-D-alanine ligase [Prosthecochloris sp.]|uniref:UDP-N-acetylmuramoyl-tripeptide--D-alanyl-D- alanine ligase n=1 Tax=Prosthecochloris sp. TaxID=290513 RepID=UPI0025F5DBE7|nr:UDP-N-acetylmuramoyl-tripeptide--D-alanyl-D-alanine ligase [Prosthecochloris sp.]
MTVCLEKKDFEAVGEVAGYDRDYPVMFADPSVVIDSRKVTGGELFFALKGEKTDGHHYVRQAFERGAACAVVNREWYDALDAAEKERGFGYLVVIDTVHAMQQLARLYRSKFDIPVIGIGGSNGKTTTKEMTASVLRSRYMVHMSEGNLNNHLGVPLTLFGLRREHEIAVVEMGINHPGEMELLTAIARPTHGLLTNIGHEHLEFLRDLNGVAYAETALYRYLQKRHGVVFVNREDKRLDEAAAGMPDTVSYGKRLDGNGVWAEDIRMDAAGRSLFTLCCLAGTVPVTLQFAGRHNVSNAVAAAAVGQHFGLNPKEIAAGLEGLRPGKGWKRLEFQDAGGIIVVNDTYNANPDSMRQALDLLCALPTSGKRVAVIGDMLELGDVSVMEHRAIGRYVAGLRQIDSLYTFGEQAALCCTEAGAKCSGHFTEEEELQEVLSASLDPGDVLLLKASRGMRLERFADGLMADQ